MCLFVRHVSVSVELHNVLPMMVHAVTCILLFVSHLLLVPTVTGLPFFLRNASYV